LRRYREAGRDYRKEDLALARGAINRKETADEKAMKVGSHG
jgi:hypothetical protein